MATPKETPKSDKNLCRLVTSEFRVSYPHVFKPQAAKPGDKLKYSITMLFPKDSAMQGQAPDGTPRTLQQAIRNAKLAEFGPKENWPADLESPVNDGDDVKYADKDGFAGHWLVKASTSEDQRPSVVDQHMVPITLASDFYPGCYARAYVYAYVWYYPNRQKPMKKGVGFILDHVQKIRNGKSFGGKKSVDQVFSPVDAPSEPDASDDDEMDFK